MLEDTIIRLIRTWVPIAVGWAISIIPGVEGVINEAALTALIIAAYYALATLLETRVWAGFGWLLGVPKDRTR